jgi:Kelch motif
VKPLLLPLLALTLAIASGVAGAAVGAGGSPGYAVVSWADARHGWVAGEGWAADRGGWRCPTVGRVTFGVCATENGGQTWRPILSAGDYPGGNYDGFGAAVRTSIRAGIISVGEKYGCWIYWTRDDGGHWYPSSVVDCFGSLISGRAGRLYWAKGRTVYQVQGWPPTGEATCRGEWRGNVCDGSPVDAGMRTVPLLTLDGGRVVQLTLLPTGFAALLEREHDLTVAVRDGDSNIVHTLPNPQLPSGFLPAREAFSTSWPRLTLRVLWLSHNGIGEVVASLEEVFRSPDGGRTWVVGSLVPGWQVGPVLPLDRAAAAAAARAGEIVLAGGREADSLGVHATEEVDALNPRTRRWRLLPSLPIALAYPAAASMGGRTFVVGGFDRRGSATRRAFVLEGGRWRNLPRPPMARAAAGAAILNGRLYVIGGVSGRGLARRMLVFEPRVDRWKTAPGPSPRAYLGVTAARGRLIALGGRTGGLSSATRRAEVYEPGARSWRTLPPVPVAVSENAVATIGNLVVTIGGVGSTRVLPAEAVYALDLSRLRWRRLPDMFAGRYSAAAATVGGRLYALGGGTDAGGRQSNIDEFLVLHGETVTTARGEFRKREGLRKDRE